MRHVMKICDPPRFRGMCRFHDNRTGASWMGWTGGFSAFLRNVSDATEDEPRKFLPNIDRTFQYPTTLNHKTGLNNNNYPWILRLRWRKYISSTFPITNGVRQGDALSSILFNLVLEAILQKMNITGHIGKKSTQILAFADDVAVMSGSKNALKDISLNP